jgi:hypothetical protein
MRLSRQLDLIRAASSETVETALSSASDCMSVLLALDDAHTTLSALAQLGDSSKLAPLFERVAREHEAAWRTAATMPPEVVEALVAGLPSWAWWWIERQRTALPRTLDEDAERLVSMRDPLREILAGTLERWGGEVLEAADQAATAAGWERQARAHLRSHAYDAPRMLEAILADRVFCEAEAGATGLDQAADGSTGVALVAEDVDWQALAAGALAAYCDVSGRPTTRAVELFTPPYGAPPPVERDLLSHAVFPLVGLDAAIARVRMIDPPAEARSLAACLDLGSVADPVWFVRPRISLARTAIAEVHEVGHVLTGVAVRADEPGAWLGVLPDLLAEVLAYGFEFVVAVEQARVGDEALLAEALRSAAMIGVGALFIKRLYALVEDTAYDPPSGERVQAAWVGTCDALGLDSSADLPSTFLLLRFVGFDQDVFRLHLLAQMTGFALAGRGLEAAADGLAGLLASWHDRDEFRTAFAAAREQAELVAAH